MINRKKLVLLPSIFWKIRNKIRAKYAYYSAIGKKRPVEAD